MTLESFETALRKHYAEKGILIIDTAYLLGRRLYISDNGIWHFLKQLYNDRSIDIIGTKIIPNMIKEARADKHKIRSCMISLKNHGMIPTPNNILHEFEISYGRPENAETFMRSIRENRQDLVVKVERRDPQRNLMEMIV